MMFATDPINVVFPAKVDDAASAMNITAVGSDIISVMSITAGTLLTMLLNIIVNTDSDVIDSVSPSRNPGNDEDISEIIPLLDAPPITMNSPMKNSNTCQSTRFIAHIASLGSVEAMTINEINPAIRDTMQIL